MKDRGFDLLHPEIPKTVTVLPMRKETISFRKEMIAQLCDRLMVQKAIIDRTLEPLQELDHVAAVQQQIATIDTIEHFSCLNEKMKEKYKDRFPTDIPHVDDLPKDIYHCIRLKDPEKVISIRAYNSPRKYWEAWHTLLQQHISAGCIHPSDSPIASPAFIIPKADPMALPQWVNDYRLINENTIPDQHPLPLVDDILADCSKGQIWAKLDMTNAFFQTLVHPDDIKYTAVRTPLGLYEWTVMPMGGKNTPATHQQCMCLALREYIGKICHVYLDDITIWSQTVAEHIKNVATVLEALRAAKLFCSDKKTDLFCVEVDFLGHHISRRGIEPQSKKVDRIMNWPTPKTARDVRAFLGLVRYLAQFLPNLAEQTLILTPLTRKECDSDWPGWTDTHQKAFNAIKQLVVSRECLTTIDHENPGDNKIFVTCDASDYRTGAVLSFGPSWETARPVAYDSTHLSGAELNYPVHEKELLAITCIEEMAL